VKIETYHFNFNKDDYLKLRTDLGYLRIFELNCIFGFHGNRIFDNVLELGCGQGRQSKYLSKYAKTIFATDCNTELLPENCGESINFLFADAQDLSQFNDCQFDLIFSSNLIEHLPHVDKCLKECRRVMKDDAIMIHSVPNNNWKIFYIMLYYPAMARHLLNKIGRNIDKKNDSNTREKHRRLDDNLRQIGSNKFLQHIFPKPHGFSPTHLMEYLLWKESIWIKTFDEHNFKINRIVRLPFYYGHGLTFISIHRFGNKIKLSSSTAYELSKAL
jgi:ubiquinone/menaquinone biosynthesis C-methylase UbiE